MQTPKLAPPDQLSLGVINAIMSAVTTCIMRRQVARDASKVMRAWQVWALARAEGQLYLLSEGTPTDIAVFEEGRLGNPALPRQRWRPPQ